MLSTTLTRKKNKSDQNLNHVDNDNDNDKNDHYLYYHFLSYICLYTIWLDLCCSYSFGTVGGVIIPDPTLYHIILSSSILSNLYLSYLTILYYTMQCYMTISVY